MEDLSKTVTTMDPITLVARLNEEMADRILKIRYVSLYSTWAGLIISLAAILGIVYYSVFNLDPWNVLVMILIFLISIPAFWFGFHQLNFLTKYRILAKAINRGLTWDPRPSIPKGETQETRIIEYLKEHDDRFARLLVQKPGTLKSSYELTGISKKSHRFDHYFEGRPKFGDFKSDSLTVFIRFVPEIEKENIDVFREELEDVLEISDVTSARFILFQSGKSTFSDDIIEYVNTHLVEYYRTINEDGWAWSSPIEIFCEDPDGHYNIGSFYFG